MSQDEQIEELENADEASSANADETNTAALDGEEASESASSVPKEGDPDYEPDEPATKKEVAVGDVEKARAKVQLDIEDAPFLEDDEEEEEEEKAEGEKKGEEGEDGEEGEEGEEGSGKKKKSKKKKLIIIGAAALLLIIIIAVAAFLFLGGDKEEEIPAEPEPYVPEVDAEGNIIPNLELEPFIVVVEPFVEPTGPPVYSIDLEPFWVESRDADNKTFFIVCNFTLIAEEEKNLVNLNSQLSPIRDAIFYHLSTQDHELLTRPSNLQTLRKSLMDRVNELLPGIKIKDLLYTNYTVR